SKLKHPRPRRRHAAITGSSRAQRARLARDTARSVATCVTFAMQAASHGRRAWPLTGGQASGLSLHRAQTRRPNTVGHANTVYRASGAGGLISLPYRKARPLGSLCCRGFLISEPMLGLTDLVDELSITIRSHDP